MDEETKKRLETLLKEEPGSLSEADRAFVRSRESYLTADERKRFASVLDETAETQNEAEPGEPAKPSKPAKK
jgi:hypothetical protein